jgi:DNA integrity scanning protein DisA with diadenylate cyclase activity
MYNITMKKIQKFNVALAKKITGFVGTMWCAYLFAIIALISLPNAIHGGTSTLISWIAQTFLQLVLLSVIMVGQNLSSDNQDELKSSHKELHAKHDEMMKLLKKL